jgi:hypothetical protein
MLRPDELRRFASFFRGFITSRLSSLSGFWLIETNPRFTAPFLELRLPPGGEPLLADFPANRFDSGESLTRKFFRAQSELLAVA